MDHLTRLEVKSGAAAAGGEGVGDEEKRADEKREKGDQEQDEDGEAEADVDDIDEEDDDYYQVRGNSSTIPAPPALVLSRGSALVMCVPMRSC